MVVISDGVAVNGSFASQLNWLIAEMIEQPHAAAQQHRHKVDIDLVEQSSLEALLRDARGADGNIVGPGDSPGAY